MAISAPDLARLYNAQIKAFAAKGNTDQRLDPCDVILERRNPTCGSKVIFTAQVMADGSGAVGFDARRACMLTQAATQALVQGLNADSPHADSPHANFGLDPSLESSASLLSSAIHALACIEIVLEQRDGQLTKIWEHLAVFGPAAPLRARHSSILLPFHTAVEALS